MSTLGVQSQYGRAYVNQCLVILASLPSKDGRHDKHMESSRVSLVEYQQTKLGTLREVYGGNVSQTQRTRNAAQLACLVPTKRRGQTWLGTFPLFLNKGIWKKYFCKDCRVAVWNSKHSNRKIISINWFLGSMHQS